MIAAALLAILIGGSDPAHFAALRNDGQGRHRPVAQPFLCGSPPEVALAAAGQATAPAWKSLFDGKSLAGWTVTSFGGEGEVAVRQGRIELDFGMNLTGITWDGGELPKVDYELALEAMKIDGNDFFCGLTFPVGDSACSLIVGGWGGGTVGLSSLDGRDASQNETTRIESFDKGRWYAIRVRVTPGRIQAWIGDAKVVDAVTKGRRVGVRGEMEIQRPLGVASYLTRAALRSIRLRTL